MLDYRLIEAFVRIVELKSFDAAARALYISQPAVSQRIKQLEEQFGQPVLIRSSPPLPTEAGEALLRHFQQVESLERDLQGRVASGGVDAEHGFITIPVALNNDSLYYWFLDAVQDYIGNTKAVLQLHVADEGKTAEMLQSGKVYAAISSQEKSPAGCTTRKLGLLRYLCIGSPEFKSRYFPRGMNSKALDLAPYIDFDEDDTLHDEYLQKYFKRGVANAPCFSVPSPSGFLDLVKQGVAYALIPDIDVEEELESGELVNLAPRRSIARNLYWHCWYVLPESFQEFSKVVLKNAPARLRAR